MAEFKLTKAQSTAVEDRGGTLLVAAAAGSGKTAILTKRIISKLCSEKDEGDISEYLIVTFTKAATAELRARLYKELSAYIKEHPENKRARRQLSLIGLAKISTIHSFCLDIIRSNFQALSLPSTLRMGEETEVNVLMSNTLDRIIGERYENGDEGSLFLKAVEILSGAKSDENFASTLLKLYNKLRGLADPWEKYNSYLEKYREAETCTEVFDTAFGKLIKDDLLYETGKTISDLDCILSQADMDPDAYAVMHEAVCKDCALLEAIRESLDCGYNTAVNTANGFSAARCKSIPKDCDSKEYIEGLKDQRTKAINRIKGVYKKYLGADAETVKTAAKESREVLAEILDILLEFDKAFTEKKLERGILDFSDLEQYTLKLLVKDTGEFSGKFERTPLAESISANYREIYIDEYQDTNNVQDMIFRAAATYDEKLGTENNRFLVGDVKQSIYRFRGAQPEIFSSYIKLFSDVSDTNSSTHKLYLSNNFRCSENVIKSSNRVFFKIMSDYTEDDSLIYSKHEENKITAPTELILVNSIPDEAEATEEKLPDEALYIASRIKAMAYNPDILDEKGNMYRYSDFAILQRSANSLSEAYRRAFRKMKIPFASDTPEDFFRLPEVLLAMCLLNCVDNPQRDIFTAGLMYSPICGFSGDELVRIRSNNRRISFYSCTEEYATQGEDERLRKKVCDFLSMIGEFRKCSRGTPTDILIAEMFDKTGIYEIYGKSAEKQRSIRKIYEMSRTFEKTSFRGLSAFLDYLNDLAEGKSDSRPEAESDSVRFMSIHRSKGLEFPVVFLSGLTHEFNISDEREPIIFNPNVGIGIKLRDTKDTSLTKTKRNFSAINTPFREAIRSTERSLMLEEEKRLLYVAMTRARDRLIMTASTHDFDRTINNALVRRDGGFESYGKYSMTYFDFIYHSLTDKEFSDLQNDEGDDYSSCFKCFKVDITPNYFTSHKAASASKSDAKPLDEKKKAEYGMLLLKAKKNPHYSSTLSKLTAKLSVSQLKKGLLDDEDMLKMKVALKKRPVFMQVKDDADYAEKGTAAHIFMQFADYALLEKNGARAEAERLLKLGFITQRMYDIVDCDSLDAFVKSDLYTSVKAAPKLYRERRFNLKLPAREFTDKIDSRLSDEFILVQGVSDLYFDNPDGTLTLVDFKTDRVSEDNGEMILRERHSEQLRYYKRAIEEITEKSVSKVYVYSFALSRGVEIVI